MENAREYEIKTVQDIYDAVNIENVNRFIKDFSEGLRMYVSALELTRVLAPEETKGKKNSEISLLEKFTWCDDGKHDQTYHLSGMDGSKTTIHKSRE